MKTKNLKQGLAAILRSMAVIFAFLGSCGVMFADDWATDTLSFSIKFKSGIADIDPTFADNSANMSSFTQELSDHKILFAIVLGYASPDGTSSFNSSLSRQRTDNLTRWLIDVCGASPMVVKEEARGIDWQGLECILDTLPTEWATEALEIVRTVPANATNHNGLTVDERKNRLMALHGGKPYKYMLEHVFPALRRSQAEVVCIIERTHESPIETEQEEITPSSNEGAVAQESQVAYPAQDVAEAVSKIKYPVFALRTNLLMPLLNVGAEVPIGNRWSIGADYYYPWIWPSKSNKNCFELTIISAEARYWFGKRDHDNRLRGHSMAAYGAWGYYDFEHNYHGHQGDGWSAGIDYVFAKSIAKGRLHLEFQIAIGGAWTKSQPYDVYTRGGQLIREKNHKKNFNYFGPTKVGISLVWPIFRSVKPKTAAIQ